MTDTARFSPELGALLGACEDLAKTPRQGRLAFLTWCQGQAKGWPCARASVSRSSWFKHLGILRAAGAPDLPEISGDLLAALAAPENDGARRAAQDEGGICRQPAQPPALFSAVEKFTAPEVAA